MEEIQLINPPRRRKRRRNARRQKTTATAVRRNPRRRRARRTRRRNPELMLVNPRRRRRARRRNPARAMNPRYRRRRRNPGMLSEFMPNDILTPVMWGGIGALGSSAVSKLVLREFDKGIVGMVGNAAVVLGMGWVARQVGGREAQSAALIGGGTMLLVKALTKAGLAGPGTMLGDVTQDADNELSAAWDPARRYSSANMPSYRALPARSSIGAYYSDDELSEYALEQEMGPGLFDDEFGDDELEDDEFGDDEFGDDDEF